MPLHCLSHNVVSSKQFHHQLSRWQLSFNIRQVRAVKLTLLPKSRVAWVAMAFQGCVCASLGISILLESLVPIACVTFPVGWLVIPLASLLPEHFSYGYLCVALMGPGILVAINCYLWAGLLVFLQSALSRLHSPIA